MAGVCITLLCRGVTFHACSGVLAARHGLWDRRLASTTVDVGPTPQHSIPCESHMPLSPECGMTTLADGVSRQDRMVPALLQHPGRLPWLTSVCASWAGMAAPSWSDLCRALQIIR